MRHDAAMHATLKESQARLPRPSNRYRAYPGAPAWLAVLILLPLAVSAHRGAAQPFEERAEFGDGPTIPVAWCDVDADGQIDLAVGNFGRANELYMNLGNGVFEGSNAFGFGTTFAVVWIDADQDGDPDLAVANSAGSSFLYLNNGDGTFDETTPFGSHRAIALAWADYDNDGDLDLAMGNGITGIPGQNRLYINQGDGTFVGEDQFGIEQTDSVAWADFDQDGDPDLAVGNGGFSAPAQNYLYVNNGDGTFTQREEFGQGDTAALAWADADGDGDLDLAVGNWTDTQNFLYLNNGDGSFAEMPAFGARDTNTVAWGDCDNDGDLDLAVGNGDFQNDDLNYLYLNQGNATFVETAEFGLGSTDSLAWADVDSDGDLDMVSGNEHSPPQNYLYTNLRVFSEYVHLRTTGLAHRLGTGYSNRDGVGARVSIYEPGHVNDPAFRLGFHEISAHGGFASQNQPGFWLGVPGRDEVDVVVEWPGSSGARLSQTWLAVPSGATVDLVEGSPLLFPPIPGSGGTTNEIGLSGARPGTALTIVASLRGGETNVPWCPGLSLALRNPTVIGRITADEFGSAALRIFVPRRATGRTVLIQAIDPDGCVVSNLVEHQFE